MVQRLFAPHLLYKTLRDRPSAQADVCGESHYRDSFHVCHRRTLMAVSFKHVQIVEVYRRGIIRRLPLLFF